MRGGVVRGGGKGVWGPEENNEDDHKFLLPRAHHWREVFPAPNPRVCPASAPLQLRAAKAPTNKVAPMLDLE
jgi:hypothetical protein